MLDHVPERRLRQVGHPLEMLDYIKASGGKDYPFRTDGGSSRRHHRGHERLVRGQGDLAREDQGGQATGRRHGLEMSVVDVEPILGQEQLTVYYMSEDRVDFRDLVKALAGEFGTRIEMRQVGGRDEARLTADYEKCGQHCCCKNFLKVLKPVSMRSAKTQKASLDPLKISGRCGRLMCCLRYEDETYADLKKRLPHRKTRVGTPEGPGIVLDSKILVQLVLVKLEADGREVAVPVEELCDPDNCPVKEPEQDQFRGLGGSAVEDRPTTASASRRRKSKSDRQAEHKAISESAAEGGSITEVDAGSRTLETGDPGSEDGGRRRRSGVRRRRRRPARRDLPGRSRPGTTPATDADGPKKRRRRRRRRRVAERVVAATGGDSGGD